MNWPQKCTYEVWWCWSFLKWCVQLIAQQVTLVSWYEHFWHLNYEHGENYRVDGWHSAYSLLGGLSVRAAVSKFLESYSSKSFALKMILVVQQIVLEIFLTSGCGVEHAALWDCSVSVIVNIAFIWCLVNYLSWRHQLYLQQDELLVACI